MQHCIQTTGIVKFFLQTNDQNTVLENSGSAVAGLLGASKAGGLFLHGGHTTHKLFSFVWSQWVVRLGERQGRNLDDNKCFKYCKYDI